MPSRSSNQPINWTVWLQSQRRVAVTVLLRLILVLGTLGIAFALVLVVRTKSITVNFAYYLAFYFAALVLYFYKRIPDEVRGAGFLIVLFVFGLYALYSGWLVSSGRVFLLSAVVVGTLLVGPRWGIYTAVASILAYVIFAFAYGFGWLHLTALPDPTDNAPMVLEGIGFAMMLVVVTAGQWLFGQALRAASEANSLAQESRDNFSSIVDRSSDGMIVVDEFGIVRFVNHAAQVLFDRTKYEFIGKPFPLAENPKDGIEIEIKLDDGTTGVADLRFVNTEWEGESARLVLVRNITERKQAEHSLVASEDKFNRAFHSSPVAMALSSLGRGFIDVNQSLCELYGFTREELVGNYARDMNMWVDQVEYGQFVEAFSRGEPIRDFQFRFRRKSGEMRIGLVSTEKIEVAGEDAFITSTIDITDLKNADEAILTANQMLRNYTNELENLTHQLILGARISRAASEVLDPEQLSAQVVETIQHEFQLYYVGLFLLDDEKNKAVLRAATGEAGQKLLEEEHSLSIDEHSMIGWSIKHCEPRIALDVGADAVRFDNPLLPETRSELALPLISRGEVIGALSIQSVQERAFTQESITWMQNMTDLLANAIVNARLYGQLQKELNVREQAEAEVRKLNEELEERVRQRTAQLESTNKELEAFSYSVSHDLRAPLRSVDGFSRILANDFSADLPDEARRYVGIIRESAQRMAQLIDDILRLSRISRGELRLETFDLSIYAHEILDRLQGEAPNRKAVIEVQSPLEVIADRNLLVIVLENLLSNAWKFTSQNEQTCITLASQYQDGDQVICVCDNGVGFEMERAQKLFGAFQRMHSEKDFPGTGIGLAIVYRIISRHGGRIWAESEPGKGTTFYFTLSE